MRMCIFCGKEKEDTEFHKEHIILESLGGKGADNLCFNVCCSCNQSFGSKVDAGLTAHPLTEILRFYLKIKGKKHEVPNPFKHVKTNYADTPITGEIITDKKGSITGFKADKQVHKMGEMIAIVGNKEGFAGYVQHECKKMNIPIPSEKDINDEMHALPKWKPFVKNLSISWEDIHDYIGFAFPAVLKMAYEFCFVKLGTKYLDDPIAIDIKYFLTTFDYRHTISYNYPVNASYEWKNQITRELSIHLFFEKNSVYAKINLYNFIIFTICMSEAAIFYNIYGPAKLTVTV